MQISEWQCHLLRWGRQSVTRYFFGMGEDRQSQIRSGSQWKVWVEKSESGVTSRHDNRSLALEGITRPPEDGVHSHAQLKCSTQGGWGCLCRGAQEKRAQEKRAQEKLEES